MPQQPQARADKRLAQLQAEKVALRAENTELGQRVEELDWSAGLGSSEQPVSAGPHKKPAPQVRPQAGRAAATQGLHRASYRQAGPSRGPLAGALRRLRRAPVGAAVRPCGDEAPARGASASEELAPGEVCLDGVLRAAQAGLGASIGSPDGRGLGLRSSHGRGAVKPENPTRQATSGWAAGRGRKLFGSSVLRSRPRFSHPS